MKITGVIIDRDNNPIQGATIEEIETGNIAISDVNGHFDLDVQSLRSTLEARHISYKTNYVFASEADKITLGNDLQNMDTIELDFTRKKPFNGLYVVAAAAIVGLIYLVMQKPAKKVII